MMSIYTLAGGFTGLIVTGVMMHFGFNFLEAVLTAAGVAGLVGIGVHVLTEGRDV